jgi:hypothetical protein
LRRYWLLVKRSSSAHSARRAALCSSCPGRWTLGGSCCSSS